MLNYETILLVVIYVMFQVLIPFPCLNQNVKLMLSTNIECDLTELSAYDVILSVYPYKNFNN